MKKLCYLAVFLLSVIYSSAQQNWKIINDTRNIVKIVPDGQKIWMASDGGLICIDKTSSDTTFYNHANSGIPFTEINDMYLDCYGRLWLTSLRSGIACKDGNNWIAYNVSDSSLPSNMALAITGDTLGNVWACLNDYLVKFNGTSRKFYSADSLGIFLSLEANMAIDASGRVLIANHWIYAFDGNTVVRYDTANSGLINEVIYTIKTFPDGKTWIGHESNGFTVTDFNTWNHYDSLVAEKPLHGVTDFDITPDGHYWLGTNFGDIYYFNGQQWNLIAPEPPADSLFGIQALAVDEDSHLYISSCKDVVYDGTNWTTLNTIAYPFQGNVVDDIIHTADGATWIANYYGITKFFNNTFRIYCYDETGNYYLSALCFAVDNTGKLYAGLNGGISYFENDSWHRLNIPLDVSPKTMCFDTENNLWIAAYPGLFKYDGVNITVYAPYLSNFPVWEVYKLSLDQNGNIIAGTANGFVQWDGTAWRQYTSQTTPIYHNKVHDMAVKGGDIWMGTSDGLMRFDGNNWEAFTPDNSPLPDFFVPTLDLDSDSTLWLISGKNNLCRFDGQNWQIIDYYSSGMLWGPHRILRIDNNNNIWTGGFDSGISIYNENGIFLEVPEIEMNETQTNLITSVYPNPVSDVIKIGYRLQEGAENAELIISNFQGKVIERVPLNVNGCNLNYPTQRLASGQYMFTLIDGISGKDSRKVTVIH